MTVPVDRDLGRSTERGQSTVEFVLVLPVVFLVLAALAQLAVISRDQVLVWNAAREAGRQAAVGVSDTEVRDAALTAAPGLAPSRLDVSVSGGRSEGDLVTVRVTYTSSRLLPLVPLTSPLIHHADATFRHE